MFPKKERVHTQEFDVVLKKGKVLHSPLFSVNYLKTEKSAFSVVASKKVSKKAVIRNRNKRRIREILRLNKEKFKTGSYIVFIRKDISKIPIKTLREEIGKLFMI